MSTSPSAHSEGARLPGHPPVAVSEMYVIPLEPQGYIVYAPLQRSAFIANAPVVRFLADVKAGKLDSFEDCDPALVEFLRRLGILDGPQEAPPTGAFSGDPEPVTVTLLLTTACNLRCTYCYAAAGDAPPRAMGLDVAKRGIDFVVANALRRKVPWFQVLYHGGGEPTTNWPVLTGSLSYARDKAAGAGLELQSSLATNGVLRDAQIDWIIANIRGVNVSFDGLPSVHDRHRVTKSGKRSSDRVIRTMRRFDQAHFPYSTRITVTADHIAALPDSVEFVCANFSAKPIQIEPVYQLGRWRDAPSAESDEFVAAFRTAQQRAMKYGREILFSAARLGTLTSHFCGVSQDNFCLSPDGEVTACYEVFEEWKRWAEVFFYGRFDSATGRYQFDHAVLNHLRAQAVQNREYCRGCFAKWSCGGDCYHKALAMNGAGEFAGAGRCHITRELTKDQILAKIASSGGLFWRE